MENSQPKKPITRSFIALDDKTPVEMIFDPESSITQFVHLDKAGEPVYSNEILRDPREGTYIPYSGQNSLVQNQIVLFPSDIAEYGDERFLLETIQKFIHYYLDLSPFLERFAAYYVLFTWVYDSFNELPYLRAIGDYGVGKSRFLKTIGGLCYKPILASGATTISPIFRMIDEFRGTFVIDEADFDKSDEKAELVKIFNNGHERGMPVIRSEGSSNGSYAPRAFHIFGPKILAARGYFQDKALESRFISEEMGTRPLRKDIPRNLPNDFWDKAREIRNMLLLFRLRNYHKHEIKSELDDQRLEPRLTQIFLPIASVISDSTVVQELKQCLYTAFQQSVTDRGMSFEGQILEIIRSLYDKGVNEPTIGLITEKFLEKYWKEYNEKQIRPRGMGSKIRNAFKVHTIRGNAGYYIPITERPKLDKAFERYGITSVDLNTEAAEEAEKPLTAEEDEIKLEEIPF